MKYYPKVEGIRIFLSPACIDDAPIYARWNNDPYIALNMGLTTKIINEDVAREALTISAKSNNFFAIIRREDNKLLGFTSFNKINEIHKNAECGIFIGDAEDRNKGYGTEALMLLLDFGFNIHNLNNIMLKVFAFNEAGIKAYKKAGFKEIGRRRDTYYYNGCYHDDVFMDITQSDYRNLINKKSAGI